MQENRRSRLNELVYLRKDEPLTDSLKVAEAFGKRHDRVLRAIDNLLKNGAVESRTLFKAGTYKDAKGETRRMFEMNRQGYEILVMGFTGDKALEWKLKYSDAFEKMRLFIAEKQTGEWIQMRQAGKLTRKAETDTIKELVELAKEQGSTHADMLYMTYSKLANKMAGISNRDNASFSQLNDLNIFEQIILRIIQQGIMADKNYKEIYQDCKERCQMAKQIAFIGG